MRPIYLTMAAQGNSQWAPVNSLQIAFAIGLAVVPSSGASLTATVQHTFDDPTIDRRHPIVIARAGTVATVTDTNHGLSVGDSAVITGSGDANLDGDREVATVVDANNYTYTVANTGATSGQTGVTAANFRVFNHATLAALVARTDGNYAFPVAAVRLRLPTYSSGRCELIILQGMGR
jgi:hypothetical protein